MTASVNRRTIVKGAAWAVPAVAVASAAPAISASQNTGAVGRFCTIYEGDTTANSQVQAVWLSIDPPAGESVIPAGTELSWTISASEAVRVPHSTQSKDAYWALTTQPKQGTEIPSGGSFTATWRALRDCAPVGCSRLSSPKLEWATDNKVRPGTEISAQSLDTDDKLAWITPKRNSDHNGPIIPFRFTQSSSGCFPAVQFTDWEGEGAHFNKGCGNDSNSVVYYPTGGCRETTSAAGVARVVDATCNPPTQNCSSKQFQVDFSTFNANTKTVQAYPVDGVGESKTIALSVEYLGGASAVPGDLQVGSRGLQVWSTGTANVEDGNAGEKIVFSFPDPVTQLEVKLDGLEVKGIGRQRLHAQVKFLGMLEGDFIRNSDLEMVAGQPGLFRRKSALGINNKATYGGQATRSETGFIFSNYQKGGDAELKASITSMTFYTESCG
ncbi:MAG: hypothetical protein Q4P36_05825 [Bowdeniella nasicola]|nr:hypothetical protein [Bowdeniella nasicola]